MFSFSAWRLPSPEGMNRRMAGDIEAFRESNRCLHVELTVISPRPHKELHRATPDTIRSSVDIGEAGSDDAPPVLLG